MSLYAIGDLHLGQGLDKPMEIFGENWRNHEEKIVSNWQNTVTEKDTVILAGDISWGMRIHEARPHLALIESLPGRKIVLQVNHDFWWNSTARVREAFPSFTFLKNDCSFYEDYAICGSRGWLCPKDTFYTAADEKVYRREQLRLRLSISDALRQGAEKIVLVMHYPPTNDKKETSGFTELINEYPQIKKVVFGHLHGEKSHKACISGKINGVDFNLVSADFLDFKPKKIL